MLSDMSLVNHMADKTGQDSACVPFEDAVVAKTLQQLTERRANRLQEIKRGLLEGEGEERVTVMTSLVDHATALYTSESGPG
jgi:hypothetical protein